MNPPKRCTATKALFVFLWLCVASAYAGVAGTVTHLSGPLLAKKADGTKKVLAAKSTVDEGDTLISEKDTYARIKFIDNSEITLRPSSQLKIDSFSFEEDKPEKDSAKFDLVKGGLRAVTGTLGKRNKERFGMNTPTATIGIRGTIFIAEYVAPDAEAVASYGRASIAANAPYTNGMTASDISWNGAPLEILPLRNHAISTPERIAQSNPAPLPGSNPLPPGLYVQVLDGMIHLTNSGGTQNFSAGQFGFTPSFNQPPIVLPANPGLKFTPPPVFSSPTPQQGASSGDSKSAAVDCEVR